MSQSRRTFIIHSVASATALGATWSATAQPVVMLKEDDPQAAALAYKIDGTKTDVKKYPKYSKEQACSNCSLYQGKASDKAAPCSIFAGKQVAAKGWCAAWVKKAA